MTGANIAVIAGDGIGQEVVPAAQLVLNRAAARFDIALCWTEFDWNCDYYVRHGAMMPDDGIQQLRRFDAIFLGAIGWPTVPDHVSLWGSIVRLRRELDLYVNLRPCRLLKGITSPLAGRGPADIDMVIVRENTEGEYSTVGGRVYEGQPEELVIQQSIHSKKAVDRILHYGFELAGKRSRRLTLATKSNGIALAMPYWDERLEAIAAGYPDVASVKVHIDALAADFVTRPQRHDVVVGSNLFGDILSDLGPAIAGSIGIAPSGNINPAKDGPSLFEPVHGSAPDIAGKGIANPIGQIWAGAMMLDHLGHSDAAAAIERAIEAVLESGPRTRDLGGTADTREVGRAIADAMS